MHELELAVGDAVCIGNRVFTLIDLEGDEAAFRIDDLQSLALESVDSADSPPPK